MWSFMDSNPSPNESGSFGITSRFMMDGMLRSLRRSMHRWPHWIHGSQRRRGPSAGSLHRIQIRSFLRGLGIQRRRRRNGPLDAKTVARMMKRFETFTFPALGSRPIRRITTPELRMVLRRTEARGTHETAHRVRAAFDPPPPHPVNSAISGSTMIRIECFVFPLNWRVDRSRGVTVLSPRSHWLRSARSPKCSS